MDRCVGSTVVTWLREQGHDVLDARTLGIDPGDEALLQMANSGDRILLTLDADFGQLIYGEGLSHRGFVRLPQVASPERVRLLDQVLNWHAHDLEQGAFVSVRGGRIRVRRG